MTKFINDLTVEVCFCGDSIEVMAEFTYTYSPGCDDYWNRSIGVWLPGDPPDLEIESVRLFDVKRENNGWVRGAAIACPDWLEQFLVDHADTEALANMAAEQLCDD